MTFNLFVNGKIVELHKLQIYREFNEIMICLGVFLLVLSIGFFFASIIVGVILAIIGIVLIIFGFRKRNVMISQKKEIYYLSQRTQFLLKNPALRFSIKPVVDVSVPK